MFILVLLFILVFGSLVVYGMAQDYSKVNPPFSEVSSEKTIQETLAPVETQTRLSSEEFAERRRQDRIQLRECIRQESNPQKIRALELELDIAISYDLSCYQQEVR